VTAAAVILTPDFPLHLLDDSKKLTESQRNEATRVIINEALAYSVGWAWPEEIDSINILRASLLAMKRAFLLLSVRPDRVLVDGPYVPDVDARVEAVVHGDSFVKEIEAASILAKTARDRWMIRYSWIDDRYGFDQHKGYPTREHRRLCLEHGLSAIHRRSFRIFPSE